MPIYEYECESCGKVIEKWQKITEKPIQTCERCGGRLHKLVSMSSFHLKGSGWYVTDYAKKSTKDDKKEASSKTKDAQGRGASCGSNVKVKGGSSGQQASAGDSSHSSNKKAGK